MRVCHIRCGPCKQFTPILAKFYEDMKKKGKKFEIVWVSSDRSSEDFVAYYQMMPWAAMAMQNIEKLSPSLGAKYKLKGIPHLVFLDGDDASVYTLDGRSKVLKDKYGLEFPYAPRSLQMLLPKPLRRLISGFIDKGESAIKKFVAGILESLSPKKVIAAISKKLGKLLQRGLVEGLAMVANIVKKALNSRSKDKVKA